MSGPKPRGARQSAAPAAAGALLALTAGCATNTLPLHKAIVDRKPDTALELIAAGQPVSQRSANGMTPLHLAAEKGQLEVMKALLARGADSNAGLPAGVSPVQMACVGGSVEAVDYLVSHEAEFSAPECLRLAASRSRAELVQVLLQRSTDVKTANTAGLTALHLAAAGGHLETVDALLAVGADPLAAARDGRTPYDAAVGNGHAPVAQRLLAAGAQPHDFCCSGKLHAWNNGQGYHLAATRLLEQQPARADLAMDWFTKARQHFDEAASQMSAEADALGDRQLATFGRDFLMHLAAALGHTTATWQTQSIPAMQEQKTRLRDLAEKARVLSAECAHRMDALQQAPK